MPHGWGVPWALPVSGAREPSHNRERQVCRRGDTQGRRRGWVGKDAVKELGLYPRQAGGAQRHFLAHSTTVCVQALGEPRPRLLCSMPGEWGISASQSCPALNAGLIVFGVVLSATGWEGWLSLNPPENPCSAYGPSPGYPSSLGSWHTPHLALEAQGLEKPLIPNPLHISKMLEIWENQELLSCPIFSFFV